MWMLKWTIFSYISRRVVVKETKSELNETRKMDKNKPVVFDNVEVFNNWLDFC